MPIIQRPDLVAKIRKEYELEGPDAIATISPELVPVVVLDDLADRGLGAQVYAQGYNVASAVAAQYSTVMVWNPTGSGIDVFLQTIIVCPQTANGPFDVRYWTTAPTSGASAQNTGMGRSGVPAAYPGKRNDAVPTGAVICPIRPNLNFLNILPFPYRIEEGAGISVTDGTVNQNLACTFFWYETAKRV